MQHWVDRCCCCGWSSVWLCVTSMTHFLGATVQQLRLGLLEYNSSTTNKKKMILHIWPVLTAPCKPVRNEWNYSLYPCWLIFWIPSELPMLDQILNISTRSNTESIIKIFYHLTTWFTSSGSDRFEPVRTRSTYFPLLRTPNWTSGSVPATART